ncbi:hypothetical protein PBOR_10840 [Paenibacillus borealis]|uniref:Uncharacterized protein n=1 Tax=Paenibacillus borealis TaxID=160799 RepID=A0A089L793_PAEBO|nr:hypothetical protein PBOR_10840 [Paenibacillus borealis]
MEVYTTIWDYSRDFIQQFGIIAEILRKMLYFMQDFLRQPILYFPILTLNFSIHHFILYSFTSNITSDIHY